MDGKREESGRPAVVPATLSSCNLLAHNPKAHASDPGTERAGGGAGATEQGYDARAGTRDPEGVPLPEGTASPGHG